MTAIFRLLKFEFRLVRILFFRIIVERLLNTVMAALAGFGAVYVSSRWSTNIADITHQPVSIAGVQSMILFSFLYAETILASWQYTINRTGRMELIFNSTQPPLRIVFIKNFVSAVVTFGLLILIYGGPLAWFGLMGAFNVSFLLAAVATMFVCCCVMSFNAVFEFRVRQVKALTSTLNLVLPYMATRYAADLPSSFGFIPYFNGAKFLSLNVAVGASDMAWLFLTAAVTGSTFLLITQMVINRIRSTASVYLE